ncbi:MAG: DUF3368 domain-containing protein [Thermoflexales bacterium]|nr:DUF3368 domain-containing protein [Thermoflexales bacterium]
MIVVSDATPLIALAKIGQINLLRSLFGKVYVPQAVYDEVVTHASHRPGADEVRQADWIEVCGPGDRTKVDYLQIDLDTGEAEALVLAEKLSANLVLVDETKARLAADTLKLKYIGTVGLLLLAKRRGLVPQIRPLIDELRAKKFRLSEKVYQAVLRRADE